MEASEIVVGGVYGTKYHGYVQIKSKEANGQGYLRFGFLEGENIGDEDGLHIQSFRPHKGDLWWRTPGSGSGGGLIMGAHGDDEVLVLLGESLGWNNRLSGVQWGTFVPYDPIKHTPQPAKEPGHHPVQSGLNEPELPEVGETWEHGTWQPAVLTEVTVNQVFYCRDGRPQQSWEMGNFLSQWTKAPNQGEPVKPLEVSWTIEHGRRKCPTDTPTKCPYATPRPIVTDPPMPRAVDDAPAMDTTAEPGAWIHWRGVVRPAEERRLISVAMVRTRSIPLCILSDHPVVMKLVGDRLCWVCEVCG